MATKRELKIGDVDLQDDAAKLTLRVSLQNQSGRTLHAYATPRALRYDPATKTLEVQLSDRGLQQTRLGSIFLHPKFIAVDPNSAVTLELPLPRVIARIKPGQEEIAPVVEELPAYEANRIDLEIAYSGTPFYPDPRPGTKSPRQVLIDWAEGVAKYSGRPTEVKH
ncbi:hypothetical protein [Silvibacterium acidisoli]|uniref:hypothetical protein n=1 Tax=Acidobacteriaceae bacterium ZG23-2 TaxID=2883246 RepID=UPI00406D2FAD